jgi:hypothetical protein
MFIIRLSLLFMLAAFLASCSKTDDVQPDSSGIDIYRQLRGTSFGSPLSVIAHAGGGIQHASQLRHTNSFEAVMKSIEDGKILIEIDFQITSDGVIVGSHHWQHTKEKSNYVGEKNNTPLTHDEFKSLAYNQSLTQLDIFDINEIFRQHPQLILVTDKITNYELLTQQFAWLDRMIVECFSYDECLEAMDYGITNVALNISIDASPKLLTRRIALLKQTGIRMTTFNAKTIKENPNAMSNAKRLFDEGFVNLVYTSNEHEFIRANIGVTASAVYTDDWSLVQQKCLSAKCNTY